MNAKFGTTLFFEAQIGYAKSMKAAAKAGFKNVDFDLTEHNDPPYDKEEKFFSEVKRIADGEGIILNQAHAPYVKGNHSDYEIFESDDFSRRVKDSIRRAAFLGIPYIVAHPYAPYPPNFEHARFIYDDIKEENTERNLAVFDGFKQTLKEYGVKMAIENVNAYDFLGRGALSTVLCTSSQANEFIDRLGTENFCICFDCGHLNVVNSEPIADFVKNVGKRIEVLHLHDNFGIQNDWFGGLDRHLLPFMGSLDWNNLKLALKAAEFSGVYSFESSVYGPTELIDDYYALLYKSAEIIFRD